MFNILVDLEKRNQVLDSYSCTRPNYLIYGQSIYILGEAC